VLFCVCCCGVGGFVVCGGCGGVGGTTISYLLAGVLALKTFPKKQTGHGVVGSKGGGVVKSQL